MVESEDMDKLQHFTVVVDASDFQRIFGDRLGKHLWGKFVEKYDYDVVKLWAYLDGANREKLLDGINAEELAVETESESEAEVTP